MFSNSTRRVCVHWEVPGIFAIIGREPAPPLCSKENDNKPHFSRLWNFVFAGATGLGLVHGSLRGVPYYILLLLRSSSSYGLYGGILPRAPTGLGGGKRGAAGFETEPFAAIEYVRRL